jgi:hypothetical protein
MHCMDLEKVFVACFCLALFLTIRMFYIFYKSYMQIENLKRVNINLEKLLDTTIV